MLIIVSYYSQLDIGQYKPALALIDSLLTELKRLDDKMILTEVHLLESRVHRGTGNFPKAKVCNPSSFTSFLNIRRFVSMVFFFFLFDLIGRPHLLPHRCKLDLLPTPSPSRPRPPIWNSSRGGQRLHDCVLILLRDIREHERAR